MAKFLAVFTGEPGAGPPPDMDEKTIAQGMAAWGQWMATHAASVVDTGGPLGKTKKVSKGGVQDISNHLAGYVVIEAASPEAAAGMFKDHPHFTIFPGDGVEIMPVLPIPGAG
jgi:hypothetical protein